MAMKKVECLGIVGKFPTPKGIQMFYDTGIKLSAVDIAEALILQHSYLAGIGEQEDTAKQVYDFATRMAKKANVYPIGYAALAEDGRILVTEPWFESKDTDSV